MPNTYDIGDAVELTGTFTVEATGAAIDPATVSLTVRAPGGTETTYTYAAGQITKSDTGVYKKTIYPDASSSWHYRWWGTLGGNPMAAEEGWFAVRKPAVTIV